MRQGRYLVQNETLNLSLGVLHQSVGPTEVGQDERKEEREY